MEKKILPLDGTCCQRHLKIIKHGKLMVTINNFTYISYNYDNTRLKVFNPNPHDLNIF